MFTEYFGTKGSFFNDSASNLFMYPLTDENEKVSDLMYLADNTYMFSCLLSYMNNTSCKNISPLKTVIL
jgi:hypothetical protein